MAEGGPLGFFFRVLHPCIHDPPAAFECKASPAGTVTKAVKRWRAHAWQRACHNHKSSMPSPAGMYMIEVSKRWLPKIYLYNCITTRNNNFRLESLSMPALNAYPPWRERRGSICAVPKSTSYPIISWSLSIVGMVEEISQLRCGVRQVLRRQFLRGGRTLKLSIHHPS